jgi:hypothetical protein
LLKEANEKRTYLSHLHFLSHFPLFLSTLSNPFSFFDIHFLGDPAGHYFLPSLQKISTPTEKEGSSLCHNHDGIGDLSDCIALQSSHGLTG